VTTDGYRIRCARIANLKEAIEERDIKLRKAARAPADWEERLQRQEEQIKRQEEQIKLLLEGAKKDKKRIDEFEKRLGGSSSNEKGPQESKHHDKNERKSLRVNLTAGNNLVPTISLRDAARFAAKKKSCVPPAVSFESNEDLHSGNESDEDLQNENNDLLLTSEDVSTSPIDRTDSMAQQCVEWAGDVEDHVETETQQIIMKNKEHRATVRALDDLAKDADNANRNLQNTIAASVNSLAAALSNPLLNEDGELEQDQDDYNSDEHDQDERDQDGQGHAQDEHDQDAHDQDEHDQDEHDQDEQDQDEQDHDEQDQDEHDQAEQDQNDRDSQCQDDNNHNDSQSQHDDYQNDNGNQSDDNVNFQNDDDDNYYSDPNDDDDYEPSDDDRYGADYDDD